MFSAFRPILLDVQVSVARTPTLTSPRPTAWQKAAQSGTRQGADWGDKLELGIGGMTGLALTAVATYGMVFGGAVVGTMLGAGLGPVVASLASHGAWGFVTTTLSTAGTAARAGMILGGVTGALGAFSLGTRVGGKLAHGVGFAAGFAVGGAKGLAGIEVPAMVGDPDPPAPPRTGPMFHGAFRPTARFVAGAAAVSGGVGGFVGGATLAAAGSLAHTALSSSLTWSGFMGSLPTTALVGGLVGAVALAYIGGKGGLQVVQGAQWLWDKTGGRLTEGHKSAGTHLEEREKALGEREQGLDRRAEELQAAADKARQDEQQKIANLERREQELGRQETELGERQASLPLRVESGARQQTEQRAGQPDASLDAAGPHPIMGERHDLKQWQGKLEDYQGRVDRYQEKLKS